MKILVASDKFKGTLTAKEVSDLISEGLPDHECVLKPVADGGEGTSDILGHSLGATTFEVSVQGPLGSCVSAPIKIALDQDGVPEIALMEMSAASGLSLINKEDLDPWKASTFGTGELIIAARDMGVDKIILGIGGSATNDGGSGMAKALGVRFYDNDGHQIEEIPHFLNKLDRVFMDIPIDLPEIIVATDVSNPLLGEKGATRSYGPQKGICENDIEVHESRLKRLADVVENELNLSIRNDKGAGAAGGLGFGLKAFCDATLVNGFDLISEMTSLEEAVMSSDLIITGEGSIDAQSIMGKAPFGVAKLAHKHNKPVVAFCGILKDEEALGNVFDKVFPMVDSEVSVEEAINDSSKVLKNKVDSCRLMIEQLVL